MDVSEIRDEASLRAWLESLPAQIGEDEARRWAVLIAHRAAMRVLPLVFRLCAEEWTDEELRVSSLKVFRLQLICAVALTCEDRVSRRDINKAINGSSEFALIQVVASSRLNVAYNSIRNASAALLGLRRFSAGTAITLSPYELSSQAVARSALALDGLEPPLSRFEAAQRLRSSFGLPAARADCMQIIGNTEVTGTRLWNVENTIEMAWAGLRPKIASQESEWHFWTDWYDKALKGERQDWDLLTKVALIPSEDWDKGADHVNALIAEIVGNHRPATPQVEPPKITDVIRSHVEMIVAVPEPSRQSAIFLKNQLERLEQAYRLQSGCVNETPEELEPFVILARTFGQIETLLRDVSDKDSLIAELQAKIAVLESQNAKLLLAVNGPKASIMRDIFIGTIGSAAGGITATAIIAYFGFLGGPAVADGIKPLQDLIAGPLIDYSVSVPPY